MIQTIVHSIAGRTVQFTHNSTESLLNGIKVLVKGTLQSTGAGLDLLSNAFLYKEDWKEALKKAGVTLRETGDQTTEAMEKAIHSTNVAFEKALFAVDAAGRQGNQMVFDNRVISSIIGSSHDQKIILTKIEMSFRDIGKDISVSEAVKSFRESGQKESVLFLPGLFTDETVWLEKWIPYKKRKVRSLGIATELSKKNIHPLYIRYNHGMPIHENGKKLMYLLDVFFTECPEAKPHIVAYSLGSLVLRSCLYHAKEENKPWVGNFKKVVSISSPNRGSYLEKLGFWLGLILEKSPNAALKIIGMIGNLRSDAIKDLSFGLIRREQKSFWAPISQYFQETYFGELDEVDAYEAYSLVDTIENPIQNFLGDGIVEKQSLRYLSDKVYSKKLNPSLRTLEIEKANHFTILNSKKLFRWLDEIFSERA
ncbi:lipase family alpha/beta hydrolase [Leptospira ilyithenensis]|uniref:Alpha/beta hydrolase n=1 Tax=Leptospira ilyithenensis TaxID=2484901 RepID=A0A4R9LJJ4_9LEPT|nr:hypothetical protein [Leptospira ilyithenensis]TGN07057.1 hypothetical protein EHS11_18215 [Leptospira ilyithenensis]